APLAYGAYEAQLRRLLRGQPWDLAGDAELRGVLQPLAELWERLRSRMTAEPPGWLEWLRQAAPRGGVVAAGAQKGRPVPGAGLLAGGKGECRCPVRGGSGASAGSGPGFGATGSPECWRCRARQQIPVFNAATALMPWRTANRFLWVAARRSLQCGHGVDAVENAKGMVRRRGCAPASSGRRR